jgi:type VI secretion system secreted protein Hcp
VASGESPTFGKAVATGTHYPTATLTLYSGGLEKPSAYMIYTMTDVLITSVQHGGSANDIPTEQVSLNYAKLQVTHKELEAGAVQRQALFSYDLAAAKAG